MLANKLKYNRYKINREPQQESGVVTVLLNLSHKENFEFVLRLAADRAAKLNVSIRGLFLDLNEEMGEKQVELLYNRMNEELKKCGYEKEFQLDVENQSFHKLLDSYFTDSAVLICDSGFTNAEKRWRHYLARTVGCEMVRVEKRRSNRLFNLDKIVESVSSEKITLPDLMSWINRDVDLFYA